MSGLADILTAIARGGERVSLVIPRGWKRPPGFPRGELLCENTAGENVYSFKTARLAKWISDNFGVRVVKTPPSTNCSEKP